MNSSVSSHESRAAALPQPRSCVRPALVGQPTGLSRLRADLERRRYVWQEYWESAATREASAVRVSGAEKQSGAPLRALYFGSGNHLPYVLDLLYGEHRVEDERPKLSVRQARRWAERARSEVDLFVADLPWPYHRLLSGQGLLEMPAWLDQKLPLPDRWDDVFGCLRSSAKGEDLRNIRRHGFTYRIVRDEAAIRRFYSEMYVPHVTHRFGEAAFVEPEWKIQYCAGHGALMEILCDGEVVAGQVLYGHRDNLQFLWAGTRGAQSGRQPKGLFPALFYYGLLYTFEHGYRTADYCGSRSLLSDGVFQLKRRWGGAVYDGWSLDTLFFRPNDLGPANLGFLTRCPAIARSDRGLVGKVCTGQDPIRPEDVARARQLYATEGLRAVRLYSLSSPGPDALAAASATTGIELVDLSREREPAAAYCSS